MGKFRPYVLLVSLILLVFVVVFLFSSPEGFSDTISFIDTELYRASGNERAIRVNIDLGKEEQLRNFPHKIGEWEGVDHDTSKVKGALGADMMLLRTYTQDKLVQHMFLLVMQSESESSFHPPTDCYPYQGYNIETEGKEQVYVADTSWANQPVQDISKLPKWAQQELKDTIYYGWVPVKTLIVFKQNEREVTERRLVLYFYVKDRSAVSNRVDMVQVSALVPTSGSYNSTLNIAKTFMGSVVPLLFEPHQHKTGKLFITYLVEWGWVAT